MDEWLRRYTTKSEADIPALKECLEGIQPRDISWLMRSIRRHDSPTAAIIAAQTGHTEVSRLLLTRLRESADELLCEKEEVGRDLGTALHRAARRWHAMALYAMLGFATLETISFILDLKNREKRTPLKEAQHEKKRETAELPMRWQQQPILEALTAARKSIDVLQEADRLKTKVFAEEEHKMSLLLEESLKEIVLLRKQARQIGCSSGYYAGEDGASLNIPSQSWRYKFQRQSAA
ncbi:uncharacterized protein [Watersipora subatra]|uniref:uncharacterized protein isoform X2 n=1 Tax=Watersipora subatra TaxID=2589382 RepID=UPI00355AD566